MPRSLVTAVLAALLILGMEVAALCAPPQTMNVQVKQSQIRSAPSFLGKVLMDVAYGDRVEALEERSGWVRISVPGKNVSGWIHGSAVTSKRILLKVGGKDMPTGASTGEMSLASKGFNSDVEAEFRKSHRSLDYKTIDQMEAVTFDPQQLIAFLREGDVVPGKEVAR